MHKLGPITSANRTNSVTYSKLSGWQFIISKVFYQILYDPYSYNLSECRLPIVREINDLNLIPKALNEVLDC